MRWSTTTSTAVALALGLLQSTLPFVVRAAAPTVSLNYTTVTGVYGASYDQDWFLGIPYVHPPVGQLRFAAPSPIDATRAGPTTATAYGPACPQNFFLGAEPSLDLSNMSEDCLYLNILRPSNLNSSSLLPVMVWIHGGSFQEGGSHESRFNGTDLVHRSTSFGTPMIFVSFQYRLGALGFASSPLFAQQGLLNLGLRDQREALYWIQRHIKAFGGDPKRITLAGESAGAISVQHHQAWYGGKNESLFQAAILESGTETFFQVKPYNDQQVYNATQQIVDDVGCGNAKDTLSCLRQVNTATLQSYTLPYSVPNLDAGLNSQFPFKPVIDGTFLVNYPVVAVLENKLVDVPTIVGQNTDEGTLFVNPAANTSVEFVNYVKSVGNFTDQEISDIEKYYPDNPADGSPFGTGNDTFGLGFEFKRLAAFATDMFITSQRRLLLESQSAAGRANIWSYRFDQPEPCAPPYTGVMHTYELPYVFDRPFQVDSQSVAIPCTEPAALTLAQQNLSDIASFFWVSFVVSHKPLPFNWTSGAWPAWTAKAPVNFVFQAVNASAGRGPHVEQDNFRQGQVNYLMNLTAVATGAPN